MLYDIRYVMMMLICNIYFALHNLQTNYNTVHNNRKT